MAFAFQALDNIVMHAKIAETSTDVCYQAYHSPDAGSVLKLAEIAIPRRRRMPAAGGAI
jgi:hypothetical protein